MRDYPQHEDIGLIEDDRTEDLRRPGKEAPEAATSRASETTTQQSRKVPTR